MTSTFLDLYDSFKAIEESNMRVELLKPEPLQVTNNIGVIISSTTDEVTVFCPACKTLETLYFSN